MFSNLDRAVNFAVQAHAGQERKASGLPYITHPLSVAFLLSSHQCEEALVVAGLLHDTVEDTPATLQEIEKHFGKRVAGIVSGCSEPDKSAVWEDRKKHTHRHLETAPIDVCLVACADKIHNLRSMSDEYERFGEDLWQNFKRGKDQQKWYFTGIYEVLKTRIAGHSLFADFEKEYLSLFGEKN